MAKSRIKTENHFIRRDWFGLFYGLLGLVCVIHNSHFNSIIPPDLAVSTSQLYRHNPLIDFWINDTNLYAHNLDDRLQSPFFHFDSFHLLSEVWTPMSMSVRVVLGASWIILMSSFDLSACCYLDHSLLCSRNLPASYFLACSMPSFSTWKTYSGAHAMVVRPCQILTLQRNCFLLIYPLCYYSNLVLLLCLYFFLYIIH